MEICIDCGYSITDDHYMFLALYEEAKEIEKKLNEFIKTFEEHKLDKLERRDSTIYLTPYKDKK